MMKNTLFFLVALLLITFASAKVTVVKTKTTTVARKTTTIAKPIETDIPEVSDAEVSVVEESEVEAVEVVEDEAVEVVEDESEVEELVEDKDEEPEVQEEVPQVTETVPEVTLENEESSSEEETTSKPAETTTVITITTTVEQPTTTIEKTTTTTTTEKPTTTTTTTEKTTTTTTTTTVVPTPTECVTEVFGVAQKFNAFLFGNFQGISSDVQGRLAAMGDIDIKGGYQNGAFTYNPVEHNKQTNYNCDEIKDYKYTIVAGGSINYKDNGEILNGGIAYGKEVTLPSYIKDQLKLKNCPVEKATIIDFEKTKKDLTELSEKLGKKKQNTKTTNQYGKLVIDLVKGQKLYVIDADKINEHWDVEINENGVDTKEIAIVLNFTKKDIVLTNFNVSSLSKYATKIIWNAPNAKNIKVENFRIQGSLLAPNADIEGNNANIQGTIIANNFKGNQQIDWVPFQGCIVFNE